MNDSPKVRTRHKNGKWLAVWYDRNEKRDRSMSMDTPAWRIVTEADAQKRARQIELELAGGNDPRSKTIDLATARTKFEAWATPRRAPKTMECYREALDYWFAWLAAEYPAVRTPRHLRRQHIEEFQTWRKSQVRKVPVAPPKGEKYRRAPDASGRTISARTVNIEISAVRTFLAWCVAEPQRYMRESPMAGVRKLREPRPATVFLSRDEERALEAELGKMRHTGAANALAFRVLIETGLRPGELFGALRKVDVDWEHGRLRVVNHEGHTTKTLEERAVPLKPATLTRLRGLAAQVEGPLLFPRSVGSFRQAVTRARKTLKMRAWPYALRHTAATRITQAAGIRAAQALLGHRRITTTERYAHLVQSDIDAAAARMWEADAAAAKVTTVGTGNSAKTRGDRKQRARKRA